MNADFRPDPSSSGVAAARLIFHFAQDGLNLLPEERDIDGRAVPHLLKINAEVFVDKQVAQSDHIRPGDFRMDSAQRGAQSARRLSDDLQVVNNPNSDQLVLIELAAALSHVSLDAINGIQNVEQAATVVSHKGTASRRTSERIRCFRPFWLTTSTLDARRLSSSRINAA